MDLFDIVISGKISREGGGGDITVEPLSVTENGSYTAPSGKAYSPVTVSVPQSGITPVGVKEITSNGMYDIASFASASVSVPTGVFPSGTSSITANGIYDITNFASVDVNVSGGGGDHDVEDAMVMGLLSGAYINNRVSFIRRNAFAVMSALTEVTFQDASVVSDGAFLFCVNLLKATIPNTSKIYDNAFSGCKNLISIYAPMTQLIGSYAFGYCSALESVEFSQVKEIYTSAFRGCYNLEVAKFLALESIYYTGNFSECSKLMSLYILSSSVCLLNNANAFYRTPMSLSSLTGSFGSIYVPASLVSDYKVAKNWSAYADRITSYVE